MQLCVRGVSAACARFSSVLLICVSDHGPRRTVLLDRDEAGRLVEATRRIGLPDAEADRCVSLSDAGVDEAGEEPVPDSLVSTRCDDGDRQLGHVLGGKAVAMVRLRLRAVPGCAHRSVVFGNQPEVARSRPADQVHLVSRISHHLVTGWCRLVRAPDGGLAQHRREERNIVNHSRAIANVFHTAQSPPERQPMRNRFECPQTRGPWLSDEIGTAG